MDAQNMFHVLAPNIQQIGRGVKLCGQEAIESGTLVCFLDRHQRLHYGFAYKNGSNLRVVCWEGNRKKNKTVFKGVFIIAFTEVTSGVSFNEVNVNLLNNVRNWFDERNQQNVKEELVALNNKKDIVNEIIERLPDLTIDELQGVKGKMDELLGN